MNQNSIIIGRCANGWEVQLPFLMEEGGYPIIGGGLDYGALVSAGKAIHLGADPIMEKIEKEKRQEQSPEEKPVEIKKQGNVYVFKTFPEVISFLKYKIIE
jgi:hypothetical protein